MLVRGRTRVKQQLQDQVNTGIAREDATYGRQRAACTVTAHSHMGVAHVACGAILHHPLHHIPGIVNRSGELVLRRQPVVHRQHCAMPTVCELTAQPVMRLHTANGEAPTCVGSSKMSDPAA